MHFTREWRDLQIGACHGCPFMVWTIPLRVERGM